VPSAPVGNCAERPGGGCGEWGNALGVEADKEELVAEPERKVLKHGRVKMRPQPVDRSLSLLLDVPSRSLPALGKIWRRLIHWDLVHQALPIGGRAGGSLD